MPLLFPTTQPNKLQSAFRKVANVEEQIRAVEIAVVALVASSVCRKTEVLRTEIKSELSKLLVMEVSKEIPRKKRSPLL